MKYCRVLLLLTMIFIAASCEEKTPSYPEKLQGLNIQYKYANDREYNIKLEKEGLSYRYVSGSKPEKWWGPFPYHHALFDEEYHIVAWHEVGYDDYITLIIELEENKLFGSGIIAGEEVHFQPAVISRMAFE